MMIKISKFLKTTCNMLLFEANAILNLVRMEFVDARDFALGGARLSRTIHDPLISFPDPVRDM